MLIEINLDPRINKRPTPFYAALATLCLSLLILSGIAAWYFLLQQELNGIRQRLTQAEEERSHIQQQLQDLHTGINESNYWYRYGQLIEELENLTDLTLSEVVLQLRNVLPPQANVRRLDITATSTVWMEVFVMTKSDAGQYLDAIVNLPYVQTAQLQSIRKLDAGGHLAHYELSILWREEKNEK